MSRPIAPRVTVIGHAKCSCCGSMQEVKVNKNGRAYFFCRGASPNGDLCNAEHKLSPFTSAQMVAKFANVSEPANENGPPSEPKQASGGGFFV